MFSDKPVSVSRLVLGFSGWPDAGRIVEYTLSELKRAFPSEPLADWDLDGYWHAESTRPRASVEHGQIRKLEWPVLHFWTLHPPMAPAVLLGAGPEPTMHWRSFVQRLFRLLTKWNCREIVLLGGFYDQIFHEDIQVSGVGHDIRAYNQLYDLKCPHVEYTGPGAIHSAIMTAAQESNLYCLSFWAHYPFYLSGRHESLMARMLQILGRVLDLNLETEHLSSRWEQRVREIEESIKEDQDLVEALDSLKKGKPRRSFSHPSPKVVRLDDFMRRREEPPLKKE